MTNYLKATLKDPENATYEGEDQDEKIRYVLRQSYLTTIPWLFGTAILFALPSWLIPYLRTFVVSGLHLFGFDFIFVLTIFLYLFAFGFFLQSFLNWFFNIYIVTSKKIIDVDFKGLLYKNISETTLDNIEDVTSNVSGTLGTIFNIGNVLIQTAAETHQFEFENIDDPSKVRDIISDLAAKQRHDLNN